MAFNTAYPTTQDLKKKAGKRIPKFAFDYLVGGADAERGIGYNINDLRQVKLKQIFLRDVVTPDLKADLCGIPYAMPFGIAPVGLQGLMWPDSPLILAQMAAKYNIPYVLSTVSTASIERVAKASDGQALFQLYNPQDDETRHDLLQRAMDCGYRALFVTIDMASFGYRPRDIRNGLILPPKMYMRNIVQMMGCPTWGLRTLQAGMPRFETLKVYMDNPNSNAGLSSFMENGMSRVVKVEHLQKVRDQWQGPLIVKGVLTDEDMDICLQLGVDGVVVSNHGARQLDCGQSAISILPEMVKKYGDKIDILFDSGIQSGIDIACALASGAKFTFAGRSWMYGVCALGKKGASHTAEMFERQLSQAMTQMGCDKVSDLVRYRA